MRASAPGARLEHGTWPCPVSEVSLSHASGSVAGGKKGTLCFVENLLPFNTGTPTEDHGKTINHDHHILIITWSFITVMASNKSKLRAHLGSLSQVSWLEIEGLRERREVRAREWARMPL